MTEAEVLELLRRKVEESGNQSRAAEELGVSASFLSDVLATRRPISAPKLLDGLGIKQVVSYEPIDAQDGISLEPKVVLELVSILESLTELAPAAANRLMRLLDGAGYHPSSALVSALIAASQ